MDKPFITSPFTKYYYIIIVTLLELTFNKNCTTNLYLIILIIQKNKRIKLYYVKIRKMLNDMNKYT